MSIKLFIFFFSAECRFLAFFLFLIWQHCHYAMDSTLVYLFLFLHIFNIKAAILLFLLCANGDLYRAYLIYWHFRLHSNTTYYNLWIFCVIIKNFKKSNIAHIVGNNNARMLFLASWHCCYWSGASISWLVAVFFFFDAIICSLIYSFQSLVYIQWLVVSYQVLHILSFDIKCAIHSFSILLTVWFCYS